MIRRISVDLVSSAISVCAIVRFTYAGQEPSLDELKAVMRAVTDRGPYPLEGFDPGEIREVLSRFHSLDRNECAASWSIVGNRYMAKVRSAIQSRPALADLVHRSLLFLDFIGSWKKWRRDFKQVLKFSVGYLSMTAFALTQDRSGDRV